MLGSTIFKSRLVQLVRGYSSLQPKSYAFSGCGWLIPFHLGVISSLRQNDLISSQTVLAGTSGGSISSFIGCCNIDEKEALNMLIKFSKNGEFQRDIDNGLRFLLKQFVDENTLSMCNTRLHVVVTKLWPNPTLKPKIMSTYESEEELIQGILASSFIPLWSTPRLSTSVLGETCIDGGVFRFMPEAEITVSPFSIRIMHTKKADISPALLHVSRNKHSTYKLLYWALNPPSEVDLRGLFDDGKAAADIWFESYKNTNKIVGNSKY